jgi:hypothetical protein
MGEWKLINHPFIAHTTTSTYFHQYTHWQTFVYWEMYQILHSCGSVSNVSTMICFAYECQRTHSEGGKKVPGTITNCWLTPWSRVLSQELTGFQLDKKFPAIYGNRRFITTYTSARHLSLSWARARSIQSMYPQSHFLKIHLDIILPSVLRSSKWSLSLVFSHQNPTAKN